MLAYAAELLDIFSRDRRPQRLAQPLSRPSTAQATPKPVLGPHTKRTLASPASASDTTATDVIRVVVDTQDDRSYRPIMSASDARQRIVAAAMKTILERGYNRSGVQDIAAAARVPKGSFYTYFASKEALGAELVEQYEQSCPGRAGLKDKAVPALVRLRRHFEVSSDFYIRMNYRRGCLLGNFSAELSGQSALIRKRLAALFLAWTKDIESTIRDAQAEGTMSTNTNANTLAMFLLDAYEGAILRARVEKSRRAFDTFMSVAFATLLVADIAVAPPSGMAPAPGE
jgi:TetR/AcrR family transcriptional repressor of nem operon